MEVPHTAWAVLHSDRMHCRQIVGLFKVKQHFSVQTLPVLIATVINVTGNATQLSICQIPRGSNAGTWALPPTSWFLGANALFWGRSFNWTQIFTAPSLFSAKLVWRKTSAGCSGGFIASWADARNCQSSSMHFRILGNEESWNAVCEGKVCEGKAHLVHCVSK